MRRKLLNYFWSCSVTWQDIPGPTWSVLQHTLAGMACSSRLVLPLQPVASHRIRHHSDLPQHPWKCTLGSRLVSLALFLFFKKCPRPGPLRSSPPWSVARDLFGWPMGRSVGILALHFYRRIHSLRAVAHSCLS